jgi:beta-lactamase superfamily II metal-dependent hydrolase
MRSSITRLCTDGELTVDIYTLHVGQGQFVVVTGETEAIIVDTFVPLNPAVEIVHVKSALAQILSGRKLAGLMVSGFDADHFSEVGLQTVLSKYRPRWILYPRYFKDTSNASRCFAHITRFETQTSFERISACVSDHDRRFYNRQCEDFRLELFSPHTDDMNSSNNCSLVCRIEERATKASYLVTGDTEGDRWDSIVHYFGERLRSDVLAAPHHGSRNGITYEAMRCIDPHTVLISAGVRNPYGHPDEEAMKVFRSFATQIFSTNHGGGQSMRTRVTESTIQTTLFEV